MRSFCSCNHSKLGIYSFGFICCIALAFESGDKTDRIIAAAKARAHAALKEKPQADSTRERHVGINALWWPTRQTSTSQSRINKALIQD